MNSHSLLRRYVLSPVNTYRRFGVRYCLHLHGGSVSQATSKKQNVVAGLAHSSTRKMEAICSYDALPSAIWRLGVVSPLRFLSRVLSPQFTLHCSSANTKVILGAVTCLFEKVKLSL
jgi:hypothetical protein